MTETNRKTVNARAYPISDAQRYRGLDAVKRIRVRQTKIRIGCLNIGTLTGKSREVAEVIKSRKIDMLCLQETRWPGGKSGGKARTMGDGCKLYYRGRGKPRNGVGICLQEEWQDRVIAIERKSDRIMSIKLITSEGTYNIVTVYAPQQGCEEEEKQKIWDQLEAVTSSIPDSEQIIIAGDLHGHVGVDRGVFARWNGGKTIGRRSNEGEKI